MTIIEILSQENGGHRNQTTHGSLVVPSGWAVVPPNLQTPNFPFGDITVEEIDGAMTVTNWEPRAVPDPDPVIPQKTIDEKVTLMEAQISALSSRNEFLEDCMAEMAIIVYS